MCRGFCYLKGTELVSVLLVEVSFGSGGKVGYLPGLRVRSAIVRKGVFCIQEGSFL